MARRILSNPLSPTVAFADARSPMTCIAALLLAATSRAQASLASRDFSCSSLRVDTSAVTPLRSSPGPAFTSHPFSSWMSQFSFARTAAQEKDRSSRCVPVRSFASTKSLRCFAQRDAQVQSGDTGPEENLEQAKLWPSRFPRATSMSILRSSIESADSKTDPLRCQAP